MKTKTQTKTPITYDLIQKRAKAMEKDTVRFLSDLVRTQSFSSKEKNVIAVIKKEMKKVGFDGIRVDGLGNIIGRIGKGPRVMRRRRPDRVHRRAEEITRARAHEQ